MIATTRLTFFLAATSDAAAERVLNRVRRELTELNLTVTARDKNIFEIQQPIHSWEHHVYGLLELCGHLGRQWVLTGDIGHLFDAFSSGLRTCCSLLDRGFCKFARRRRLDLKFVPK